MRAFVRLRRMLATHADLARKIEEMEKRYDSQFKVVFDAIRKLMERAEPGVLPVPDGEEPRNKIGFQVRDARAPYKSRKSGVRR
jgi:hypothetical protein